MHLRDPNVKQIKKIRNSSGHISIKFSLNDHFCIDHFQHFVPHYSSGGKEKERSIDLREMHSNNNVLAHL